MMITQQKRVKKIKSLHRQRGHFRADTLICRLCCGCGCFCLKIDFPFSRAAHLIGRHELQLFTDKFNLSYYKSPPPISYVTQPPLRDMSNLFKIIKFTEDLDFQLYIFNVVKFLKRIESIACCFSFLFSFSSRAVRL